MPDHRISIELTSVADEQQKIAFCRRITLGISVVFIEGPVGAEVGCRDERDCRTASRARASQRNTRRAGQNPTRVAPVWKPGDAVRWKGRSGSFRCDVGDGEHAEIALAERIYRVRLSEIG
jgi:hypothetical protein